MVGKGILQADVIVDLPESRGYLCTLKSIPEKYNAVMQVKLPLPTFQVSLFGDPLDCLSEHVIHYELVLSVSGIHFKGKNDLSALLRLVILGDLSLKLPLLMSPPFRVLQVSHGPSGKPPTVFHICASSLPCLLFPLFGIAGQGSESSVGQQVHLVRLYGGFLGTQVPGLAGFFYPLAEESTTEASASLEALTQLVQMPHLQ